MRINALLVVWIVVLGIAQLAISAEMELPRIVTQGEEINLTLKLDGSQACLVFTPLEGGEPFTYSCFFKDGTFSIDSNRLSLGTYRVELKDSANDQILASSFLMVTSEPVQQLTGIYSRPNPFDLTLPDARVEFVNAPAGSTIRIFDLGGVEVISLSGSLPIRWDGRNEDGDLVSSGSYIYLVEDSGGEKFVGKMAVIK
jgi:hypothetical protein